MTDSRRTWLRDLALEAGVTLTGHDLDDCIGVALDVLGDLADLPRSPERLAAYVVARFDELDDGAGEPAFEAQVQIAALAIGAAEVSCDCRDGVVDFGGSVGPYEFDDVCVCHRGLDEDARTCASRSHRRALLSAWA